MVGELDEAGKSSTYSLSGTPASDVSPTHLFVTPSPRDREAQVKAISF